MAAVLGTSSIKNKVITGERSLASDPLLKTRKTFSITYYVQATSTDDNTDTILAATGIPSLLSISDSAYLIRQVATETDAAALLWEVECSYDSHVAATGGGIDGTRPWPAKWTWGSEAIDVVLTRDPVTGKPITNSVGEPILITTPVSIPVLTVEKLETNFSPTTILAYENKVNSTTFYGAPAKCALLSNIQDSPVEESGTALRKVIYTIKFNLLWDYDESAFLGWMSQPLNQGTKFKPTANSKPFEYKNFEIEHSLTEDNLALDGTKLASGAAPVYLKFNQFLTANFNTLQLGPFS